MFYTDCRVGLSLKKFAFSTDLLNEVGIQISELITNYIKTKRVSFEILSAEIYQILFKSYVRYGIMKKLQ